jgi:D-arabinose 1-dehydrogenase-like Zn-dependent alcohol dehydrogenase
MKAAQFRQFGGPEVLEIVDLPDPHPGPGQVRIVVHAAGITATDPKLRAGALTFGAQLPQTTGRDVAGVIDEIGEGVTDVAVGDRVFGVSDDGAGAAELALLTFRAIIPPSLGFVDAAGLPVALETATRAIDQLGVRTGSTLFINGASGGIGSTAVQLAAARGARVIGAASAASASWAWSGQAWPSVPQCMNTMTIGASRRAARTAARVRGRSIALASPGRLGVATQDEASSATWETPTTANLTPLMVRTYGAHAAAALAPIPT